MALNAYLKIVSPTAGWIKGSVIQKGREGLIKVVRTDHLMERPLDLPSFTIAATIQHRPFLVVKEVDAASIGLRTCFIQNETLSEWRLQYFRAQTSGAGGSGLEVQFFTVELTGAKIQSIHHVLPDTRDRTLADWLDYEEVAFVYDSIKWTYVTGGKTTTATVKPPVARVAIPRPKRRR